MLEDREEDIYDYLMNEESRLKYESDKIVTAENFKNNVSLNKIEDASSKPIKSRPVERYGKAKNRTDN